MFNIGGPEVLVIALIALVVVGPEQLPSVLRKLGKQAAQLRAMTQSVRDEFMSGVEEINPTSWMEDTSDTPKNPTSRQELEKQMNSAEKRAEEQALGKQAAADQQAKFEAKAEQAMERGRSAPSPESQSAQPETNADPAAGEPDPLSNEEAVDFDPGGTDLAASDLAEVDEDQINPKEAS